MPTDARGTPFIGEGEMARRMRALDWRRTPLDDPGRWPEGLKATVRILLTSRYAMWMCWGPELTFFCNDAYLPTVGVKQEWVLGAPAHVVWREIWPEIGPRIETVLRRGEATWDEALQLFLHRSGFLEETYHTFSYSPVFDDRGGIGGMLCVVTEVTEQLLGERRMATLRALAAATPGSRTAEEVCARAAAALAADRNDVPFALIYLLDQQGRARLAGRAGVPADLPVAPESFDPSAPEAAWPLPQTTGPSVPDPVELGGRHPDVHAGPWPERIARAAVLPMAVAGSERLAGFLVLGLSTRLAWNAGYQGFLSLAAGQVAGAVADARAFETERRRLEELAELDRAKTAFFNNISHEFRTPLTLLLAPVAEARLAGTPAGTETLELVHRNALRLQRLVNSLLEFSRLEAGRADAVFRPTDLAELTRDLAASFRAAFERAGLRFVVETRPLPGPVYVDRDMWERVVLNLLSNALKFTLEGEVTVRLSVEDGSVHLRVRDTGSGIAPEEQPRLFQRFHRVHGARARTHEGSGIGLALVSDIVRLHGGEISVRSRPGEGSEFDVRVPLGRAHLPPDRVREEAAEGPPRAAEAYLTEALRWVTDEPEDGRIAAAPTAEPQARILVADDNADMRDYLGRVLRSRYSVQVVANGSAALASLRDHPPDLLLTDVMMPEMDGFDLLTAVRADSRLRSLPVVILSARAGEEARSEGLEAGADDYLVKPFSARELLARVDAQLARARLRRLEEVQAARLRTIFREAPVGVAILGGPGHRFGFVNAACTEMMGGRPLLGRTLSEALPELDAQGLAESLEQVHRSGEPFVSRAYRMVLHRGPGGAPEECFFHLVLQPLRDEREAVEAVVLIATEVTELVSSRHEAEVASRAKDEFLAMLGHELRNPLAPVVTALHLMKLRAPGAVDRERAVIERQVRNLSRLVEDLLDVSRIARGKVELRREPVDLAATVAQAIETSSPLIEERHHQLSVEVPPGLLVLADATRLTQIVANLLTNAAKYTDPGGQLRVRVRRDGAEAVLQVSDDGIGIPAELIPHVFDTFFQGGQGRDRARGGLGLGLALVRSFVHLHGGTVSAESAGPGAGSTFTVRLPLHSGAGEPRALARAPGPAARTPRTRLRVLVVDDNVDAAEGLREFLSLLGHEVEVAHDGGEGLRKARAHPPDLALLDLGLPGMDGLELGRAIRERAPGTCLVAVTGYGQESDRRATREAGFARHLVKPVDLEELEAFIGEQEQSRASPAALREVSRGRTGEA